MTPGQFERVRQVFAEAQDLPQEARQAHIERALADDIEARREVFELLANAERAAAYFDALGGQVSAVRAQELSGHWATGRLLGAYRIDGTLGSGGMGVVYRASRADGQFERDVAIKVLPLGLDSATARHRFDSERRILASLRHPNIAELLDAGLSEDGRPYLIMERVDGQDLLAHAQARSLDLKQRVALFARVCDAVHFAHQSLVVHRDIKPSNILVSASGEPKLLDFGIARLLDPEGPRATTTLAPAFTPAYAAPEQHSAAAVGTAADVFALGVVLYELVTGSLPDLAYSKGARDTAPDPPLASAALTRSDAAAPAIAQRSLRGDLDQILLKAMQAAPARRYGSAAQFAEDLRRWLDGLPVSARPDSFGYRAARLLRRRPWASAAAALALFALVGFSVFSERQARRIAEERDRAERVAELLVDVFTAADPASSTGRAVSARELLDRGVGKVRERLAYDREARARLLLVLGRAYLGLAEFEPATPVLDEALRELETLYGRDDVRYAAALVHRAERDRLTGKLDTAETQLRAAVDVFRRIEPAATRDRYWAEAKLGRLLVVKGDATAARILLESALTGTRALPAVDARWLSERLNDVASVDFAEGKFAEAKLRLTEVVALQESVLATERRATGSADLATALNNLGLAHMQMGDVPAAREFLQRALEMRRLHLPAQHPELAQTLSNLGVLLQGQGDLAAAEPVLREALEIRSKAFGAKHPQVAQAQNNLAMLLQAQGDYSEAEQQLGASREVLAAALGAKHPLVATADNNLGSVAYDAGNFSAAQEFYQRALQLRRQILPAGHPHLAYSLLGLGLTKLALGEITAAEPLIEEGAALRLAKLKAEDPLVAEAHYALGKLRLRQGRLAEAGTELEQAAQALQGKASALALLASRVATAQQELAPRR